MTRDPACPDLELLSRYLDHELDGENETQISQHLAACPDCRSQVKIMEQAETWARTKVSRVGEQRSLPSTTSECLSPEMVAAYVQHILPVPQDAQVESHLHACHICLTEVTEAFRVASVLVSSHTRPVPLALKTQVTALWTDAVPQEKARPVSRLVIRIVREGLQLLEQYLVPPLVELQEQEPTTAMPAYRSEQNPADLTLKLNAGQAEIRLRAVKESDGVGFRLTLLDAARQKLAARRIFLRQHGRAIFSEKTDHYGELRTPRLDPGSYEIDCPEIQTTFHVELRS